MGGSSGESDDHNVGEAPRTPELSLFGVESRASDTMSAGSQTNCGVCFGVTVMFLLGAEFFIAFTKKALRLSG